MKTGKEQADITQGRGPKKPTWPGQEVDRGGAGVVGHTSHLSVALPSE